MNKKIISIISISIIIIIIILSFFFIIKLLLSGYFTGKSPSDPKICNNLKENEVCVCEKYDPLICHIEKNIPASKSESIKDSYLNSTYKIVKIIESDLSPYFLVIATDRAEKKCGSTSQPEKCTDDSACGSIYTSPTCYFFLEPQYHIDATDVRYIGKWDDGGIEGIHYNSESYFNDKNNVRFHLSGGDGPATSKTLYNLNLDTGNMTVISKEFYPN